MREFSHHTPDLPYDTGSEADSIGSEATSLEFDLLPAEYGGFFIELDLGSDGQVIRDEYGSPVIRTGVYQELGGGILRAVHFPELVPPDDGLSTQNKVGEVIDYPYEWSG